MPPLAPAPITCRSCTVRMDSDDYVAHHAICVADERTTRRWLEARHAPEEEATPREYVDHPRLRVLAVVVSSILIALNLWLLGVAATLDWS